MSTAWFGTGQWLRIGRIAAWLIIPALAAGCAEERGGGDRTPPRGAEELATTAFERVAQLEALTGSLSEADSFAAVYGVFESSAELLQFGADGPWPSTPSLAQQASGGRCITASPRRIVFERCRDAGAGVALDADFRFTDGAVTGVIAVDVQAGPEGADADYHLEASYDLVRTGGCVTGGAIEVTATGEFRGFRYPIAYLHVSAEFGPGCGEVKVYRESARK